MVQIKVEVEGISPRSLRSAFSKSPRVNYRITRSRSRQEVQLDQGSESETQISQVPNTSQLSTNVPSVPNNSQLEDIKPQIMNIKMNPIKRDAKFICPKCGKLYKHEFRAKTHVDVLCTASPCYRCPHCDKTGKYYYNIISHLESQHPGLESYAIDTDTNQIKRLQTETTQPYQNPIVDKKPVLLLENRLQESLRPGLRVTRSQRQKSINIKQENANTDETPDISDSAKDSLRKLQPNTCQSCGKSFTQEYGLSRHILEGCESFRYQCPYCLYQEQRLIVAFCHLSKEHAGSKIYMIDNMTGKNVELGCATRTEIPVPAESSDPLNGDTAYRSNCHIKKIIGNKVKNPLNKAMKQFPEDPKQFQSGLNKEYECPNKCGRYFGNFRSINLHVKLHCVKVKRFKCPFCDHISHAFRFIVTHIKANHPKEKVYALDLKKGQLVYNNPHAQSCGRKKTNPRQENPKIENPKIDIPRKRNRKKDSDLLETLPEETPKLITRIKHEKIYPCSKGCGRLFSHKHHMKTHAVRVCNLPKRYKCPYCEFICKISSRVTSHINNRHRHLKNYFIDILGEENPDSVVFENNENVEPSEEQRLLSEEKLSSNSTYTEQSHEARGTKIEAKSIHLDDFNQIDSIGDEPNEVEPTGNFETAEDLFSSTQVLGSESNGCNYLDILEAAVGPENDVDNFICEYNQIDDFSEDEVYRNDLSEEEINKEISKFVSMEIEEENVENVGDPKMRNIMNPFSKKFTCPNKCGSAYTRESTLKSHLRFECHFNSQTPNGYVASKEKNSDTRLRKTVVQKAIEEDNAEVVELGYESADEIDEPIVEVGNDVGPPIYRCPFCQFDTEIPEEGYDHIKRKHPNEKGVMIDIRSDSENEVDSHTENDI